jgi:ferrochelatase
MAEATLPPAAVAAHARASRSGVLLLNLGTPDAAEAGAIRRYLAEFLSDRRVVELPRAVWWPVLHGWVLPFRPSRLVHAYQSIWSEEGSPLLAVSRAQCAALQRHLGNSVPVVLAMRYGQPSIARALGELDARDVRRLLVLPLYPQYSGSTTGSSLEAVYHALMQRRWIPELRSLASYHDHPAYVDALAQSVQQQASEHGACDHLLMSFHGLPRRYVLDGDPYFCQCHKTARLLAERLGLAADQWSTAFQSRFGRSPWVGPATDARLGELAASGVRRLRVICPGFSADCLETLEEVNIRYRRQFLNAGGEHFDYVPALNDTPMHMALLAALVDSALSGWALTEEPIESHTLRSQQAAAHVGDVLSLDRERPRG